MLARIGPVKPFLDKSLIVHSACGRTEHTAEGVSGGRAAKPASRILGIRVRHEGRTGT
jgi:hypothetical protein